MTGSARGAELTGFTVGLTAQRRSAEFRTLLARHGAITVEAAAIRIVHLVDDDHLRQVTKTLIDDPAEVLIATTGFGFRGWIDAAHAWGWTAQLFAALRRMRLVARGPKALGAIRHAGLREDWAAPSESSTEVVDRLLADAAGMRIAVQLHGAGSELEPNADVCRRLAEAGAEVIKIPVYRWQPPIDLTPMDNLIATVLEGRLDALTFTSAPAVASVLARATTRGLLPQLVSALDAHTLVACVGPVTATPLNRIGVSTVTPARYRLGALARLLLEELPQRATHLLVAGHDLSLRNTGVVVDGCWRPLAPAGMALLRALIAADGLRVAPGDGGNTQTAIGRLRTALGAPDCIQTVERHGYRLALD